MFERLTERLDTALKKMIGRGKIRESDIDEAMREVRRALLEADVNFKLAREFSASVRERAVGKEVLASVSPAQQVVKIVQDELTDLLGGDTVEPAACDAPSHALSPPSAHAPSPGLRPIASSMASSCVVCTFPVPSSSNLSNTSAGAWHGLVSCSESLKIASLHFDSPCKNWTSCSFKRRTEPWNRCMGTRCGAVRVLRLAA